MAEQVTIVIEGDDQASDDFKRVLGSIKESEKGVKSLGSETRKLKKSNDEAGGSTKSLGGAFKNLNLAAVAASVGIASMATAVKGSIEAFAEQEQVDRQLEFRYRSLGATAEEAARQASKASQMFAENQGQTVFGDEEQSRALNDILRRTEDTARANELLSLSMDAATASGRDLRDASKALSEAQTGDLGPLKELGLLTQEQIKNLNELEDPTERAARAFDEFRGKIEGARFEVGDTQQSLSQISNDMGDLEQALGKAALAAGEFAASMVQTKDSSEDAGSAIAATASQISQGADNLLSLNREFSMGELASTAYVSSIKNLPGVLKGQNAPMAVMRDLLKETGKRRAEDKKATDAQKRALQDYTLAVEKHGKTSDQAKEAADRYTQAIKAQKKETEAADDAFRRSTKTREQLNAELRKFLEDDKTQAALEKAEKKQKEAAKRRAADRAAALKQSRRALELAQATTEQERIKIEHAQRVADIESSSLSSREKQNRLEVARIEKQERLGALQRERREGAKAQAEADAQSAKRKAEEVAQQAHSNEQARMRMEIMREQDAREQSALERKRAIAELNARELGDDERKLAMMEIEAAHEERLSDIREKERRDAEGARKKEADDIRDLAGVFSATGSQMAADVGNVVDVFADIKEGKADSVDAMGAVGNAAASFAGQLGASAEAQAGIMAAFETAMGFATLFTNPAESAAHFLAAANFGMIAATGGGGGAGGGASQSSVGGGQFRESADDAARASGRVLAENLGGDEGPGSGEVIYIDFSGATMLESAPRVQERIGGAVDQAKQRKVRRGARRG